MMQGEGTDALQSASHPQVCKADDPLAKALKVLMADVL